MALTNFTVPVGGDNDGPAVMPKMQFRFRVTFSGLGEVGGESANGVGAGAISVSQNVISVTRPGITYDESTLDVYNSRIYMIGKHSWDPITLVVRDDVGGDVVAAVNAQLASQTDHATQQTPRINGDFKFGMNIDMLNGNHGGSDIVSETFGLQGCMLTGVQFGDMAYSASEMVQITMTIRYDNAIHNLQNGTDTLGKASASTSSSDSTSSTGGFGGGLGEFA